MTTTKTREIVRQVLLRRPCDNGYREDVYWIRNDLAKLNKRVKDEDGKIWTVAEVYSARPCEDLDAWREAWKKFADVLDGH